MAKIKGKKKSSAPTKRRAGRPKNEGPAYDVAGLRRKIGAKHGVAQISREVLSKLIGAAVGSIVNWEAGMVPSSRYVEQLKELERTNAAGKLKLELPRRGRKPKAASPAHNGAQSGGARPGRWSEPSNAVSVVYANQVQVDRGSGGTRIRFALSMPGSREVRAVADVVVPDDVMASLQ